MIRSSAASLFSGDEAHIIAFEKGVPYREFFPLVTYTAPIEIVARAPEKPTFSIKMLSP